LDSIDYDTDLAAVSVALQLFHQPKDEVEACRDKAQARIDDGTADDADRKILAVIDRFYPELSR
jgi:hypothetical protein